MAVTLTKKEKEDLESVAGKMSVVRDAVMGLVTDYHTGFFLWGEGGTGKSYTVLQTLQESQASYVYHNARMTGRGLVDALQRAPDNIHLIEDAETLLDDRKAWGVLRSALWSQSRKKPPEREITWTAFNTVIRFIFTGGIILISQGDVGQSQPAIRALKSRVKACRLDLTNDEIRAMMKKICLDGFTYGEDYMSPEECWGVATYIISKLETLQRNLDLRLLLNGFKDYLLFKTGNSVNHWHVLLDGRMQERVVYRTRTEQKVEETRIALEIHEMNVPTGKKIELWKERTGLSQPAYYRALNRR
jgi:hypothetical protein